MEHKWNLRSNNNQSFKPNTRVYTKKKLWKWKWIKEWNNFTEIITKIYYYRIASDKMKLNI